MGRGRHNILDFSGVAISVFNWNCYPLEIHFARPSQEWRILKIHLRSYFTTTYREIWVSWFGEFLGGSNFSWNGHNTTSGETASTLVEEEHDILDSHLRSYSTGVNWAASWLLRNCWWMCWVVWCNRCNSSSSSRSRRRRRVKAVANEARDLMRLHRYIWPRWMS